MKITAVKLLDNVSFERVPTAATEYAPDEVCDARGAESVTIWVTSTLNQAVTIQVTGNDEDDPGSLTSLDDIGGAAPVAIGSTTTQRRSFTVNLTDYRYQFYGVTVLTGATGPTAGRLDVTAYLWHRETDDLLRELIALLRRH